MYSAADQLPVMSNFLISLGQYVQSISHHSIPFICIYSQIKCDQHYFWLLLLFKFYVIGSAKVLPLLIDFVPTLSQEVCQEEIILCWLEDESWLEFLDKSLFIILELLLFVIFNVRIKVLEIPAGNFIRGQPIVEEMCSAQERFLLIILTFIHDQSFVLSKLKKVLEAEKTDRSLEKCIALKRRFFISWILKIVSVIFIPI